HHDVGQAQAVAGIAPQHLDAPPAVVCGEARDAPALQGAGEGVDVADAFVGTGAGTGTSFGVASATGRTVEELAIVLGMESNVERLVEGVAVGTVMSAGLTVIGAVAGRVLGVTSIVERLVEGIVVAAGNSVGFGSIVAAAGRVLGATGFTESVVVEATGFAFISECVHTVVVVADFTLIDLSLTGTASSVVTLIGPVCAGFAAGVDAATCLVFASSTGFTVLGVNVGEVASAGFQVVVEVVELGFGNSKAGDALVCVVGVESTGFQVVDGVGNAVGEP